MAKIFFLNKIKVNKYINFTYYSNYQAYIKGTDIIIIVINNIKKIIIKYFF